MMHWKGRAGSPESPADHEKERKLFIILVYYSVFSMKEPVNGRKCASFVVGRNITVHNI